MAAFSAAPNPAIPATFSALPGAPVLAATAPAAVKSPHSPPSAMHTQQAAPPSAPLAANLMPGNRDQISIQAINIKRNLFQMPGSRRRCSRPPRMDDLSSFRHRLPPHRSRVASITDTSAGGPLWAARQRPDPKGRNGYADRADRLGRKPPPASTRRARWPKQQPFDRIARIRAAAQASAPAHSPRFH